MTDKRNNPVSPKKIEDSETASASASSISSSALQDDLYHTKPHTATYQDREITRKRGIDNLVKQKPNSQPKATKIDDKTSSEINLGKDYVVVEKKSVEVNSLADELAKLGSNPTPQQSVFNSQRKRTSMGSYLPSKDQIQINPTTNTLNETKQITNKTAPLIAQRRPSVIDRRLSISSLNPSGALSKALEIASTKLFGATTLTSQNSPYQPNLLLLNPRIFQDLTENIILRINNIEPSMDMKQLKPAQLDSNKIVHILESQAARAYVVYSYAEVKFQQIAPLPPKRLSTGSCAIIDEEESQIKKAEIADLPPDQLRHLCTEAIMLYMKALSILAKSMKVTSGWWYESNEKVCSLRLNLLVQWIRERFNECLEKADFLKLKLDEISKSNGSSSSVTAATANVANSTGLDDIVLEKLLYDRALEISRTAAKMELSGENLYNCEISYATALWMLETSLESDTPSTGWNKSEHDLKYNMNLEDIPDYHNVLDEHDKQIIRKYMDSITHRLKSLRTKMTQL